FMSLVDRTLRETGIDPSAISLEVTEGTLMADPREMQAALARFKQIGVRVSIDDFGTGYSSLSCLHTFPIDVLKVDHSFVRDMETRRAAAGVVHAIIGLAHNLGMR